MSRQVAQWTFQAQGAGRLAGIVIVSATVSTCETRKELTSAVVRPKSMQTSKGRFSGVAFISNLRTSSSLNSLGCGGGNSEV